MGGQLQDRSEVDSCVEFLTKLIELAIRAHLAVEMLLDFVELTLGGHQALDLIREALVFDPNAINFAHATGLSIGTREYSGAGHWLTQYTANTTAV